MRMVRIFAAVLMAVFAVSASAQECVLRQSTASQELLLGPFFDRTDGVTAETGLTIANTDVRISKAGANIVAKNSGGGTHDELGVYQITLDATDTNTVGTLDIFVDDSEALPIWTKCLVLEEAVFDITYAAAADGGVPVDSIASGAIDAASIATGAIDADAIAASAIGASEIAADAIGASEIAAAAITNAEMAIDGSELTAVPYNSSWDAEIQSEAADALTAYDPPTRAELTADIGGLNDLSTADVNAQVDTALQDIHLDHLLAVNYDPASQPGVATSLFNEIIENDGGVARFTANALEQGPSAGGSGGLTPIVSGTAQGGTASTIQLAASTSLADDRLNSGVCINLTGGTGAGQTRPVSDYVNSTDTATVEPDWVTNPSSDTTYEGVACGVNVVMWDGADITTTLQTAADIRTEIDSNSTQLAAIVSDTNELQTDDVPGLISALDTVVDRVETDTQDLQAQIGTDGDGLTAVPYNSAWDAEIQSEVDDAIIVNHLDHLLAVNYDPASKPGSPTAYLNELVEDDSGVSRFTVNALEQGPSGGGASAAAIRAEMDANSTQLAAIVADTDELQTDDVPGLISALDTVVDRVETDTQDIQAQVGTAGAGLTNIPYNSSWDVEIESEAADALTAYDPPTKAEMDTGFANLNDPTAAAIAAAVMAETCEDQGSGYTVQECLSILLAEAAGVATYTTGTRTFVVSDPSGSETRLTLVYGSSLDGDRTSSTPAPATP